MISDDEDDFLGASESPVHHEEGSTGGGGSTSDHNPTNHDGSPSAESVGGASIRDHLPKQASLARVVTEALLPVPSSSIHVCPVVLSRERITPPSPSPSVSGTTSR